MTPYDTSSFRRAYIKYNILLDYAYKLCCGIVDDLYRAD